MESGMGGVAGDDVDDVFRREKAGVRKGSEFVFYPLVQGGFIESSGEGLEEGGGLGEVGEI